eukprot:scaffold1194_cov369-Prasinococcus_capsulatus_cf.AAC.2
MARRARGAQRLAPGGHQEGGRAGPRYRVVEGCDWLKRVPIRIEATGGQWPAATKQRPLHHPGPGAVGWGR